MGDETVQYQKAFRVLWGAGVGAAGELNGDNGLSARIDLGAGLCLRSEGFMGPPGDCPQDTKNALMGGLDMFQRSLGLVGSLERYWSLRGRPNEHWSVTAKALYGWGPLLNFGPQAGYVWKDRGEGYFVAGAGVTLALIHLTLLAAPTDWSSSTFKLGLQFGW